MLRPTRSMLKSPRASRGGRGARLDCWFSVLHHGVMMFTIGRPHSQLGQLPSIRTTKNATTASSRARTGKDWVESCQAQKGSNISSCTLRRKRTPVVLFANWLAGPRRDLVLLQRPASSSSFSEQKPRRPSIEAHSIPDAGFSVSPTRKNRGFTGLTPPVVPRGVGACGINCKKMGDLFDLY